MHTSQSLRRLAPSYTLMMMLLSVLAVVVLASSDSSSSSPYTIPLNSENDEIADLLNSYEGVIESALDYVEHTAAWWERRYEAVRINVEDNQGNRGDSDIPNLQSTVGELGSCIGWRQTADCSPHGVPQPMFDRGCTEAILDGVSGYCQCGNPTTVLPNENGNKIGKNKRKGVSPFNGGEWQGPGVGCLHKPFTCKAMCQLRKDVPKKEVLAAYQALERKPAIPIDDGSSSSSSSSSLSENVEDMVVVSTDDDESGLGERAPTIDIRSARERLMKTYGHLILDEFDVESSLPSSEAESLSPTTFSERQQVWQTSLDNTNFALYPRRSVLHRYLSHAEERSRLSTMQARIKVAMATRPGTPIDETGCGIPQSFLQDLHTSGEGAVGGIERGEEEVRGSKGSKEGNAYRNPVDTVADVRRRVEMESSLKRLHRALHHHTSIDDSNSGGEKGHHHHHGGGSGDDGDTEDLINMLRTFELEYNLPFKGGLGEISASKKDATDDDVADGRTKKEKDVANNNNAATNVLLHPRRSAWDKMKKGVMKDLHADPALLNLLLLTTTATNNNTSSSLVSSFSSKDVELATSKLTYVDTYVLGALLDKSAVNGATQGEATYYDGVNNMRNTYAESLSKSRMNFIGKYLERREGIRSGSIKSFLGKNTPNNEDTRLVRLREERADFEEAIKAGCFDNTHDGGNNKAASTQEGGVDAVLNAGIGGIDGDRVTTTSTSTTTDARGWCYRSKHGSHFRRAWAHLLDDVFNNGGGDRAHIPLPPSLQGPSAFELDDYVDSLLFGSK